MSDLEKRVSTLEKDNKELFGMCNLLMVRLDSAAVTNADLVDAIKETMQHTDKRLEQVVLALRDETGREL